MDGMPTLRFERLVKPAFQHGRVSDGKQARVRALQYRSDALEDLLADARRLVGDDQDVGGVEALGLGRVAFISLKTDREVVVNRDHHAPSSARCAWLRASANAPRMSPQ